MNIFNNDEIPVGLSMAFAENLYAMERFDHLDATQKEDFIQQSKNVASKQEMRNLVSGLETMKQRIYIQEKIEREAICLPSTSPANAAWSVEKLIDEWKRAMKGAVALRNSAQLLFYIMMIIEML